MEGEINNFFMVWSSVLISVCYCHAIAKITCKGPTRLCMFMPIICLFIVLPMKLNSVNLGCPTAFFITWLGTFKLLLLAFGDGPLSNPSLSLLHFVVISCFPVVIKQPITLKSPKGDDNSEEKSNVNGNVLCEEHMNPNLLWRKSVESLWHYGKKSLILLFLLIVCIFRDKFHHDIMSFLICIFVVVGLEVMLGLIATIAQMLLGTEVEAPFNNPYLASSLKDFWGRRWNRVSSSILRSAVFSPILKMTSSITNPKLALLLALLGTFFISGIMHEIIFYYMGRVMPGGGTIFFFLLHSLCLIVEDIVRWISNVKWRIPRLITGPLVFGFIVYTFMRLVLPELLVYNVDERAISEYAALFDFVKNYASLDWVKWDPNCWYKNWEGTAHACK